MPPVLTGTVDTSTCPPKTWGWMSMPVVLFGTTLRVQSSLPGVQVERDHAVGRVHRIDAAVPHCDAVGPDVEAGRLRLPADVTAVAFEREHRATRVGQVDGVSEDER